MENSQQNPISLQQAVLVGNWVLYFLMVAFVLATGIWLILPEAMSSSHAAIWSVATWSFRTAIGIAVVLFFLKIQQQPTT